MTELLLDSEHIGDHLSRMKLIGKTVPHRNIAVFGKLLHDLLTVTSVFYTVKHAGQNPCGICDRFLFAYLGTRRIKVSHMHAQILCSHLKGTSGPGGSLLEYQSDIPAVELSALIYMFLFLSFELSRQIHEIFYLLCGEIQ